MYRVILIPLPTYRLASFALQALQVDAELSRLVRRSFSLYRYNFSLDQASPHQTVKDGYKDVTILRTEYRATTNRMLRVATNGFMESLALVLELMEKLDIDTTTT